MESIVQEDERILGVYINLGENNFSQVKDFATKLDLKSTIVMDKFSKIGERHGVVSQDQTSSASLPKTFVLDGQGKVHAIFVTEGDDFKQKLTDIVKKLKEAK